MLNYLIDKVIPRHCEIQFGPLESEGVAVEVLGRTKTRLAGAIVTAPDPKHAENIIRTLGIGPKERSQVPSKKIDLNRDEPLNAEMASRYRSAIGSGIYLSADRRGIAFGVKVLARRMADPRQCDWDSAVVLARYLQAHPEYVRVTALDPKAYDGELSLDVYSDSDWAGCAETRRSADSHVAFLGGAAIAVPTPSRAYQPLQALMPNCVASAELCEKRCSSTGSPKKILVSLPLFPRCGPTVPQH